MKVILKTDTLLSFVPLGLQHCSEVLGATMLILVLGVRVFVSVLRCADEVRLGLKV